MNEGGESTNNYCIFLFFLHDNYTLMILANKKAASFGSSELSGRTAPGLSLATWGGDFATQDATSKVFIAYGVLQDSLCAKREETKVIP